ncbi:hypothetical protein ACNSPR_03355 [Klebsiella pneumoniae]
MASGTELRLCRVAATPYPAYSPKSPLAQGLLKLPVLAASTSLRRSRKAGAARMDAGECSVALPGLHQCQQARKVG